MTITGRMENKFDSLLSQLPDKEAGVIRKIKDAVLGGYQTFVKPILIAIFMFSIYTKLKDVVGFENAVYIVGVSIVIFLRLISSHLSAIRKLL